MKVIELRLNDIEKVFGSIKSIKTNEPINEITIIFNASSRKKIAKLLICNEVTPDVQNLRISELIVAKSDNEVLMQGQSNQADNKLGHALPRRFTSPIHFQAIFKTRTASIKNPEVSYDIEMNFDNFSFDFTNSEKIEISDSIVYQNVDMNVYLGDYTVNVL